MHLELYVDKNFLNGFYKANQCSSSSPDRQLSFIVDENFLK